MAGVLQGWVLAQGFSREVCVSTPVLADTFPIRQRCIYQDDLSLRPCGHLGGGGGALHDRRRHAHFNRVAGTR